MSIKSVTVVLHVFQYHAVLQRRGTERLPPTNRQFYTAQSIIYRALRTAIFTMYYSKLMIIAFVRYALGRAILLENPSSPSERDDDALTLSLEETLIDFKRGVNVVNTKRDDEAVDSKRGVKIVDTKRNDGDIKRDEEITKREEDITKRDEAITEKKNNNGGDYKRNNSGDYKRDEAIAEENRNNGGEDERAGDIAGHN
ncbi:hypothetical protein BPOR_0719g00020 [Botrytis porri]|uniref:Uncharacterized protein n=2 Tax=Botrytis porri TaxID=87229 RepID=A0A4Z1KC99_9HELO|nr:hypothetical protein BPOR_0719g00020 [Botrytis porri]